MSFVPSERGFQSVRRVGRATSLGGMKPQAVTYKNDALESAMRKEQANSVTGNPRLGVGVSIGCFAGVGYGLAVGIGNVLGSSRNTTLIVPSVTSKAFAHDGAMAGAFCGVVVGGGFATGVGAHFGYRWALFDDWFGAAREHTVRAAITLFERCRRVASYSFPLRRHATPRLRPTG